MSAFLVTPPAIEPVTLAEAKAHLRLEADEDDDYLAAMITAARMQVETGIRRVLIDQTWRVCRDDWPPGGRLDLTISPVRSITSVVAWNAAGEEVFVPASDWRLDAESSPARLRLAPAAPAALRVMNGLEIDLVAGFGPSGIDVPQPLRQAIMILVARWYENREGYAYGVVPSSVADAFEGLIAPFRRMRLA